MKKILSIGAVSLALAGGSGFFLATAISQGATNAATTTTVTIRNGATGPQGPPGERGPTGEQGPPGSGGGPCAGAPDGWAPGVLVINHPGGQVRIWTCLAP